MGSGGTGLRAVACPHTYRPWYTARFTCFVTDTAFRVGGSPSNPLPFFVNKYFRTSLTLGLKLQQGQQLTLPCQCLVDRVMTDWWPSCTASVIWTIILVSASSCEQGDSLFLLVAGGEQSTSSPFETLICLPSITIFTTFLLSKRKNSCQFRDTSEIRSVHVLSSSSGLPSSSIVRTRDWTWLMKRAWQALDCSWSGVQVWVVLSFLYCSLKLFYHSR